MTRQCLPAEAQFVGPFMAAKARGLINGSRLPGEGSLPGVFSATAGVASGFLAVGAAVCFTVAFTALAAGAAFVRVGAVCWAVFGAATFVGAGCVFTEA